MQDGSRLSLQNGALAAPSSMGGWENIKMAKVFWILVMISKREMRCLHVLAYHFIKERRRGGTVFTRRLGSWLIHCFCCFGTISGEWNWSPTRLYIIKPTLILERSCLSPDSFLKELFIYVCCMCHSTSLPPFNWLQERPPEFPTWCLDFKIWTREIKTCIYKNSKRVSSCRKASVCHLFIPFVPFLAC